MNKNSKRGLIILALILVVFCVIAFAIPFVKNTIFWIGFAFGVIAIALQCYFLKISFGTGDDAKSKFYGFPIAKIGVLYLCAQVLLSVIEMACAAILPVWVPLVINVIALVLVLVGCIAADTMRDEIIRQDDQIKKDVSNMRELQSLSASLVGMCEDEQLRSVLQGLADDFRYSDPVSSESTLEKETELKFIVNEIQHSLVDGDLESAKKFCVRAKANLAERNRICKLGK